LFYPPRLTLSKRGCYKFGYQERGNPRLLNQ